MRVPFTYPARPFSGGRLEIAPKKRGTWAWEPKLNGWRVLVHAPTGKCFNRYGEPLSISDEFKIALRKLAIQTQMWRPRYTYTPEWFDCEALSRRHAIGKGTLVVLDYIERFQSYHERRKLIETIPTFNWESPEEIRPDSVYSVPIICETESRTESGFVELMKSWHRMQRINHAIDAEFYEGYVAKRIDSLYDIQLKSPQHETSCWMKHRFDQ